MNNELKCRFHQKLGLPVVVVIEKKLQNTASESHEEVPDDLLQMIPDLSHTSNMKLTSDIGGLLFELCVKL